MTVMRHDNQKQGAIKGGPIGVRQFGPNGV